MRHFVFLFDSCLTLLVVRGCDLKKRGQKEDVSISGGPTGRSSRVRPLPLLTTHFPLCLHCEPHFSCFRVRHSAPSRHGLESPVLQSLMSLFASCSSERPFSPHVFRSRDPISTVVLLQYLSRFPPESPPSSGCLLSMSLVVRMGMLDGGRKRGAG